MEEQLTFLHYKFISCISWKQLGTRRTDWMDTRLSI